MTTKLTDIIFLEVFRVYALDDHEINNNIETNYESIVSVGDVFEITRNPL